MLRLLFALYWGQGGSGAGAFTRLSSVRATKRASPTEALAVSLLRILSLSPSHAVAPPPILFSLAGFATAASLPDT